MELYEHTYYPESVSGAGKAVYVKRNQHMIDESAVCVVYYGKIANRSVTKKENHNTCAHGESSGGVSVLVYCSLMLAIRTRF